MRAVVPGRRAGVAVSRITVPVIGIGGGAMIRIYGVSPSVVTLMFVVLFSSAAGAQQSAGIAGTVRDTSGAVIPGVTVEAASPALIEKVRTVVSDGEGRYNIVDVRPGTYVVTFSLGGFNTVRRERGGLTAGVPPPVKGLLECLCLEEGDDEVGAIPSSRT